MSKISSEVRASAVVLLIALVATVGLSGCGSDRANGDGTTATSKKFKPKSIGACLKRAGATQATSQRDLEFLTEAEANDEVQKPGFAYDRSEHLVVRLWSQIGFEGSPPKWTVWFGQPFGEARSPSEIVNEASPKSYVMYSVHPYMAQRKKLKLCFHF